MSDANICYLDLETSGLFPWQHGIVQIGYILERIPEGSYKGEVLVERDLKVCLFPGDQYEDKAGEVNGVVREEAYNSETRMSPRDACRQLISDIREYFGPGPCLLCGFNIVKFDEPFLRKFFTKCKAGAFKKVFYTPSLDVMLILAHHLRYQRPEMIEQIAIMQEKGQFKLGLFEKLLADDLEKEGYTKSGELHDALADINLTRFIYLIISRATKWDV
jgi:oligoribonuclease (3'-5' exoribonuclease)